MFLVADGDFDVDAGIDRELRDLSDSLGRRLEVDHPLVDAHLEAIPRLGTFSTRRLASRDAKRLGRHAHRPLSG